MRARSGQRAARTVLAAAICLTGLVLGVPGHVAAQQQPPDAVDQPPTSGDTLSEPDAPEVTEAARAAAVSLLREMVVLDALGGFATPVLGELRSLADQHGLVAAGDREALIAELEAAEAETTDEVAVLVANGVIIGPRRAAASASLTEEDVVALRAGQPISVPVDTYIRLLADLVERNGRPPLDGRDPDLALVTAALTNLLEDGTAAGGDQLDAGVPPSTAGGGLADGTTDGADSRGEGPSAGLLVAVALLVLAVVASVVAIVRRRARSSRAAADEVAADTFEEVLDVNRRLASTADLGEVERIAVREGVRLVRATEGALVYTRDAPDDLNCGFESTSGILVPDRLGDGVLERVASTAQSLNQTSRTEPSIRNLPASIVASPIVATGRVSAVLIMLREESRPFGTSEREVLDSLAPIVGAALENARARADAEERTLVDGLTGVGNRLRFEKELDILVGDDSESPTGLVMIDLDHFKSINDTYGHPAGDAVLRSVGATLRANLRPRDAVYRYGGEEFCLVLPGTDADETAGIAERTRIQLESTQVDVAGHQPIEVTASLGVATTVGGSRTDLVRAADRALYRAKELGRNRVVSGG